MASLAGAASCGGLSAGDYAVYRIAVEASDESTGCFPDDRPPLAEAYDATTFRSGQTLLLYLTSDDEAMLDIGGLVLSGSTKDDPYTFAGVAEDVDFPFSAMVTDADRDGIADDIDPFVDADKDGDEDTDMSTDREVDTDGDSRDDRGAQEDAFVDADNDGEEDRFGRIVGDTRVVSTLRVDVTMTVDGSTVSGVVTRTTTEACEGDLCPTHVDAPCVDVQRFRGVEIDGADLTLGADARPTP
ncbi:hypothetical protein BE08_41985 [Sorangium cellulosum]|uniref:Uncharacterized protein n=1 Tax=Sorangium cellulosum TaxID=56 RepID=A0A150NZ53_SORCE|nr:hypothetical protein BE08_41985 [Sorangium cellulosum]